MRRSIGLSLVLLAACSSGTETTGTSGVATTAGTTTTGTTGGATSGASGGSSTTSGTPGTVSFAPNPLTFGSQATGTTSPVAFTTLSNSGTTPVTISAENISGDFAFGGIGTCNINSPLAAGATCAISVIFTPTASGTRTGAITVTDTAPGSPQTVTLTGLGSGAGGTTTAGTTGTTGTSGTGGTSGTTGTSGASSGSSSGGYAGYIAKYGSYSSQYYVSPSGSDSNPGTQAQPWATLAQADSSAPSCSVVWFLPGTYNLSGGGGDGITTTSSGTSACHKAYVSTTQGGALIRWSGSGNGDALWYEGGNYTDHAGFDLSLPGGCEGFYGGGNTGGVYVYNFVHDIDVAGSADAGWCLNGVGGGGIEPGTNHGVIADNLIWNIGQSGNHWTHGIYIGGGAMQIYNNIVYNASGACIQDYNNSENDVIVNNTLVDCQSFGIVIGGESCDSSNSGNDYVANNIIDANPATGWGNLTSSCGSGSVASSTFTNNVNYGGGTIALASGGTAVNTVTGDPNFVNATSPASGGDFHLGAGSAALGAGTATQAPTLDLDGNTRASPPSIGAYE